MVWWDWTVVDIIGWMGESEREREMSPVTSQMGCCLRSSGQKSIVRLSSLLVTSSPSKFNSLTTTTTHILAAGGRWGWASSIYIMSFKINFNCKTVVMEVKKAPSGTREMIINGPLDKERERAWEGSGIEHKKKDGGEKDENKLWQGPQISPYPVE